MVHLAPAVRQTPLRGLLRFVLSQVPKVRGACGTRQTAHARQEVRAFPGPQLRGTGGTRLFWGLCFPTMLRRVRQMLRLAQRMLKL
jgi:hypothetical protein